MSNAGYGYSPFGAAALGRQGGNQSKATAGSPTNGGFMPFGGGYSGGRGPMVGGKIQPPALGSQGTTPAGQTPPIYAGQGAGDPTARKGYPQVTQGPSGLPAQGGSGWQGKNIQYQTNPFSTNKMFGGMLKGQMQRRGVGNVPGTPHTPSLGPTEQYLGRDYGTVGNQADRWKDQNKDLVAMGFMSQADYDRWLALQNAQGNDGGGGGTGNAG